MNPPSNAETQVLQKSLEALGLREREKVLVEACVEQAGAAAGAGRGGITDGHKAFAMQSIELFDEFARELDECRERIKEAETDG